MMKYYATIQYEEGTELNNTELTTLRTFAHSNKGSPYEALTNQSARFIAFIFDEEANAEAFSRQSENLDKIVRVQVGKLR